jgi:hypothetical protein
LTTKDIVIPDEPVTPTLTPGEITFELSSRNTGEALRRIRLGADRTLIWLCS